MDCAHLAFLAAVLGAVVWVVQLLDRAMTTTNRRLETPVPVVVVTPRPP